MKYDFAIKVNPKNNELYVIKIKDELTKNHRDNKNITSENKTDPLCPVQSFKKYLSHLHPNNKFMWEKLLPKVDLQQKVWYSQAHIGKNPLASFMSDVRRECNLSQIYTNHSIRVTGCTILT